MTPLVWSFLPIPFVTLTVLVNALNVVVLPFLTAVVWMLTSKAELIGADWTNVRLEVLSHAVSLRILTQKAPALLGLVRACGDGRALHLGALGSLE